MKAVVAHVYDDKVELRWRDGWDKTDWLPDAGDLTKGWGGLKVTDENLEQRIRVIEYGFSKNPRLRDSIRGPNGNSDSHRQMPLTNERFISVLVNNLGHLISEWDWILTEVARVTGDDSLHRFKSIGHELYAKWLTEDAQKAKTDERHRKGVTTKEKIKLRKPWTKHIIAGYERAKKKHAARVHGDSPIELFWNDVIYYADDERTADETIRFYGDDRLFDDKGKEVSSMPWGIKWTTARKEIGILKEKGLIPK